MKKPPEKIYLQWTDDPIDPYDEVGITWCIDQINDSDIEYVQMKKGKTEESKTEKLTERQKEIIAAYAEYGLGKLAARSLGIAPRTFNNHCTAIYRKLNVHNMTQAIVLAFRAGILE